MLAGYPAFECADKNPVIIQIDVIYKQELYLTRPQAIKVHGRKQCSVSHRFYFLKECFDKTRTDKFYLFHKCTNMIIFLHSQRSKFCPLLQEVYWLFSLQSYNHV